MTSTEERTGCGESLSWRSLMFLHRHRIFLTVLVLAITLRAVTMLGYCGAMWFPDSYDYVTGALTLTPNLIRPSGYSVFLWLLSPFHSLSLVTFVQHTMGVGIGVMVYALLRRRFGLSGWAAALAASPPLFDAFGIQLEHLILSDTLFTFLVTAALTLALWCPTPSARRTIVVCLLVGLAAVTRSVGLSVLVLIVSWLVVRHLSWRAVVAGLLPLALYAGWFSSRTHRFTLTESTGIFLYGRTAAFADCRKIKPPVEELPLCITIPPGKRARSQVYIWSRISPLRRFGEEKFTADNERRAEDFALRAIAAQPVEYIATVGSDLKRTFLWQHPPFPDPTTYRYYLFRSSAPQPPAEAGAKMQPYDPRHMRTRVERPYSSIMRTYQRHFFLRGPMFGLILLLGLGTLLCRRTEVLLPWMIAVFTIVVPPATAEFDYRYLIPAIPAACIAASPALACRNGKATPRSPPVRASCTWR